MPALFTAPWLRLGLPVLGCAALMVPTLHTLTTAEPTNTESSTEEQEERRPYLGVVPERDRGTGAPGVSVLRVYPASTAERLGIVSGDRILRLNGEEIRDLAHLDSLLQAKAINDEITLDWMHAGEEKAGTQTLGSIPLTRLQTIELAQLRANVRRLDEERRSLEDTEASPGTADLATSMAALAETLNTLPERLEEAARTFKKLYPDGTFTVHFEIDIRTNSTDPNAIDLGPGIITPEGGGDKDAAEEEPDSEP